MSRAKHFRFLRRRGFTLVEVLVVISITAMLAALAIVYGKTSQRQITLYIETQKLAGLIFRAKSFALGTFSDVSNPNRCGYGVEIDYALKTYSLFAYEEPSPPNCSSILSVPQGFRVTVATYNLNPGLVLKNVNLDSLSLLLFVPPSPKTLLSVDGGASLTGAPAKIYLETSDSRAQRTITVNPSGQVDF